jgi:hypothetical protein
VTEPCTPLDNGTDTPLVAPPAIGNQGSVTVKAPPTRNSASVPPVHAFEFREPSCDVPAINR